jgi:hypothetical protein
MTPLVNCNLSLYIAEFLPHNILMKKKKPSKNLSKNIIKLPAAKPGQPLLCSAQNSCTGPCPCPALQAALDEIARLEAEQRELKRLQQALLTRKDSR